MTTNIDQYLDDLQYPEKESKYLMIIGGSGPENTKVLRQIRKRYPFDKTVILRCQNRKNDTLKKRILDATKDIFSISTFSSKKQDEMAGKRAFINSRLFILLRISSANIETWIELTEEFASPTDKPEFLIATVSLQEYSIIKAKTEPYGFIDMFEIVNLSGQILEKDRPAGVTQEQDKSEPQTKSQNIVPVNVPDGSKWEDVDDIKIEMVATSKSNYTCSSYTVSVSSKTKGIKKHRVKLYKTYMAVLYLLVKAAKEGNQFVRNTTLKKAYQDTDTAKKKIDEAFAKIFGKTDSFIEVSKGTGKRLKIHAKNIKLIETGKSFVSLGKGDFFDKHEDDDLDTMPTY